jgi:hypothetical protein
VTEIHLSSREADPPQRGHHDGLIARYRIRAAGTD